MLTLKANNNIGIMSLFKTKQYTSFFYCLYLQASCVAILPLFWFLSLGNNLLLDVAIIPFKNLFSKQIGKTFAKMSHLICGYFKNTQCIIYDKLCIQLWFDKLKVV